MQNKMQNMSFRQIMTQFSIFCIFCIFYYIFCISVAKYKKFIAYAKYAIKNAKYAKYVIVKKICRICTPHFADGRPGMPPCHDDHGRHSAWQCHWHCRGSSLCGLPHNVVKVTSKKQLASASGRMLIQKAVTGTLPVRRGHWPHQHCGKSRYNYTRLFHKNHRK